jgi:tetratricopeptide (TPR) repeat protein
MQPTASRRGPGLGAAICAALALLTAFVYAPTAGNGFINLDDPEYVSANPVVRQGLTPRGAAWALRAVEQGNWHPLAWWSHMLDVSLFGVRPGPHHLVSAALHALAAILLFLALRRLAGAVWPAALVAALFAVHPLHVESVAWVAERKDVLCGLFWALALLAYARYARRPDRAAAVAVASCFLLALMAKPMAVTLPLSLLLLDWWPLGRFRGASGRTPSRTARALVAEKLPLLAVSLAVGAATLSLQASAGALKLAAAWPLALCLENALVATALYPAKMLWPSELGILYPFPAAGLPAWQWLAAGLFLAAASLAAFAVRRRHPWVTAGWLWYLLTLAPVSGLLQAGEQARADRYAYIPSIGLTVAAAWGLTAAFRRSRRLRVAAALGVAAATVALAVAARAQAGRWRDSVTLFRHTLAVAGESSLLRTNLGGSLVVLGRWEEALRELTAALAANPRDFVAWYNAGIAYSKLQRYAEAAAAFRAVVDADPADAKARYNLGLNAVALGDQTTAEEQLRALRSLDPGAASQLAAYRERRGLPGSR